MARDPYITYYSIIHCVILLDYDVGSNEESPTSQTKPLPGPDDWNNKPTGGYHCSSAEGFVGFVDFGLGFGA